MYLATGVISSLIIIDRAIQVRKSRRSYVRGAPGEAVDPVMLAVERSSIGGLKPFKPTGRVFEVDLSTHVPGVKGGVWGCVKIGSGGWGVVYRCSRGGLDYAVKIPIGYESLVEGGPTPTVHRRLMERIKGEARVIMGLRHRHVLRLVGYSETAPMLVYEYADQGSVEYQLSEDWTPGLGDALLVAAQVADALRYIHSRGLVHGDVKAGNVLLTGGVAKLGDFTTLTRLIQSVSKSKTAYTPGWRAPEQVFSDIKAKAEELGYENRIDVYQLGNLLLYLLTGETLDGYDRTNEKLAREKIEMIKDETAKSITWELLQLNPWDRPSADEAFKKLAKAYYTTSKSKPP